MAGPKTALLKGVFKEVLRTLKDDSAYLATGGDPYGAVAAAAASPWAHGGPHGGAAYLASSWGAAAPPDAYRALARLQQRLAAVGDEARQVWAASKGRARERLRQAVAAAERRYDAALGSVDSGVDSGGVDGSVDAAASSSAAVAVAEPAADAGELALDEARLRELCGTDGWARVRISFVVCASLPPPSPPCLLPLAAVILSIINQGHHPTNLSKLSHQQQSPSLQTAVMFALAHLGRAWMTRLNATEVVAGAEHLAAALAREPGRPLVTVSNHVAAADDPLVVSALLPPEAFATPERLRWTLCASDRCFHRAALVPFFRAAKVLPVERGAGMRQPGLAAAEARLRAGDWVHIFPEGTRSRDGGASVAPARKGVGRLVAACADASAAATGKPPLVVPFVHAGMADVMPRGALVPRTGQTVRVAVGPPVDVGDLLAAARQEGWQDDALYAAIAARVGLALQALKARLDGAGDLDAAALAGLAARQARDAELDLYDARDADANADLRLRGRLQRGWRAGGAARWAASVAERLEFRAAHRRGFGGAGGAAAAAGGSVPASSGAAAAATAATPATTTTAASATTLNSPRTATLAAVATAAAEGQQQQRLSGSSVASAALGGDAAAPVSSAAAALRRQLIGRLSGRISSSGSGSSSGSSGSSVELVGATAPPVWASWAAATAVHGY